MLAVDVLALVLFALLPLGGAVWLRRVRQQEHAADRVPILCYHRLTDAAGEDDEPVWVVAETDFAAQMQHLAATGYTSLDLDEFLQIRAGVRDIPARPVVLTFDDGWESVRRLALPHLARNGLRAVVYAILEPGAETRAAGGAGDRIMTADELCEVARAGHQIASHTVTHPILTELDDAGIERELVESRRRLAELLGRPVAHFCVPRGGVDRRVGAAIARAGYLTAAGRAKGTARLGDDPRRLRRLAVERHHGLAGFQALLTPRGALRHRVLGELRLVPARVLGARASRRLRAWLYGPRLRRWFGPRAVPRFVPAAALVWAMGFAWTLARWAGRLWGAG